MKALNDALMKTLVSTQVREFGDDYRYLESANVVDGLFAIAQQLGSVAHALRQLGFGDAASPKGAIEGLAMFVRENAERVSQVASAIERLAEVVDVRANVESPRGR